MTQNLPATPDEDYGLTGLEDFDSDDAVIPRLKIIHDEGLWEDNLSGGRYKKIKLVILAMVKQRILWHPTVDDNDKPMCRSGDFENGVPTLTGQPKGKEFPWDKSGFNPNDFQPNEEGLVILPCSGCGLKEWGSHPNGQTPYCAEQWQLAVLYDGFDEQFGQYSGTWQIALLSLQKSGLKSIRAYLTTFQRNKRPAFTAECEAHLNLQRRGQVDYSTPAFKLVGQTDQVEWANYAQQAKSMRNYLKRAPEPLDGEDTPTHSDNSYAGPPAAQQQSNVVQGTVVQEPTKTAPPVQQPPAAQPTQPPAQQPSAEVPAPSSSGGSSDLPF